MRTCRSLAALLLAASFAVAGGDPQVHPRAGLHGSAHDLSFLLGADLGGEMLGVVADGWIRPGYWKTLRKEGEQRWVQIRVLRFGGTFGARLLLGDRELGLMPMAGVELASGDVSGSSRSPGREAVAWGGLGAAFLGHQTLSVRVAPQQGVLGWVRGEWAWNF